MRRVPDAVEQSIGCGDQVAIRLQVRLSLPRPLVPTITVSIGGAALHRGDGHSIRMRSAAAEASTATLQTQYSLEHRHCPPARSWVV